jgi:hypothetical protein
VLTPGRGLISGQAYRQLQHGGEESVQLARSACPDHDVIDLADRRGSSSLRGTWAAAMITNAIARDHGFVLSIIGV